MPSAPRDKDATWRSLGTLCRGRGWSKRRLLHELQHGLPYRTIEPLPPGRTINWHDPEVGRSLDVEASEVTLTEVTIRRRSVMTTIRTAAVTLLALGSLSAIDVRPSAAEIYRPWCVVYQGSRDGATSCAFTSFAQCMMTGGPGTGGSCVQNPWYLAYGERGPAVATTGQGGRVRRR